jgi:endogenous inhibitor of DNA gyrase (YacG/DUF329 family)
MGTEPFHLGPDRRLEVRECPECHRDVAARAFDQPVPECRRRCGP